MLRLFFNSLLTVDKQTGLISGVPVPNDIVAAQLIAANDYGADVAEVAIVVQ